MGNGMCTDGGGAGGAGAGTGTWMICGGASTLNVTYMSTCSSAMTVTVAKPTYSTSKKSILIE